MALGNDHRHLREMNEMLGGLGSTNDLVFTPHLLPVARGILATIVVRLAAPLGQPLSVWKDFFGDEPFIELSETTPSLRDVVRTNRVKISAHKCAEHQSADTDYYICDRQSHKGSRGTSRPECESHAGPGRNNGIAGVIKVIKLGGRVQSSPLLVPALGAPVDVGTWSRVCSSRRR